MRRLQDLISVSTTSRRCYKQDTLSIPA